LAESWSTSELKTRPGLSADGSGSPFGSRTQVADGIGVERAVKMEGDLTQRPGACVDPIEPLVVEHAQT
jgi:hypothetical protein